MTTFHTRIDNDAEEYLLEMSQESILTLTPIFNSAYHFKEPHMQISKLQATALQFFIESNDLRNVVEVGSFVGFSAFSMAYAMKASYGKLLSIEINKDFFDQAERNKFNFLKRNKDNHGAVEDIEFIHADAKKIMPDICHYMNNDVDLLFLDGDKNHYDFYLKWAISNLKVGAYLIVDNALFKGGVVNNVGTYARSIRSMTEYLKSSHAFDYFFLPVGDCMIVAKKR